MNHKKEEARTLISIPPEGDYIEILGYRIDGFASLDAFCEHLKKYNELEIRAEALEKRLRHLLTSETVRLFDEVEPKTGRYKRNIRRLDTYGVHYKILEYESAQKSINADRLIHMLEEWIDLIRQEAERARTTIDTGKEEAKQ